MNNLFMRIMEKLNLVNVSYTVSNHGKEISFDSIRFNGVVKVYPTTGTWMFQGTGESDWDVYKTTKYCSDDTVNDNINMMIKTHVHKNF